MTQSPLTYCQDLFTRHRRPTRAVYHGEGPSGPVYVGGENPVRVQSMTTTSTRDIMATADQVCRLVDAKCEIVRITAPTPKDAHCLGDIRTELDKRGVKVSLVADIHFQPAAAMAAADYVDKIRVNPGNFADKKVFKLKDYSSEQYDAELMRIEERFLPLVEKCRDLKRAMRIGTNHGSLSDRIMGHYGDSPLGMVESALEFVRICEKADYHDIVLSMKASNPQVMIEANRLLAARLDEAGMNYPIHLGVTEAGDGEDGRIKSAIGIGSLLEDGIGDTIRVSLTEEPENEIPVAYALTRLHETIEKGDPDASSEAARFPANYDPFDFRRRSCLSLPFGNSSHGGEEQIAVEVVISADECDAAISLVEAASAEEKPIPESLCLLLDETVSLQMVETFSQRLKASCMSCKPAVSSNTMNEDLLPLVSSYELRLRAEDISMDELRRFSSACMEKGVVLRLCAAFHRDDVSSMVQESDRLSKALECAREKHDMVSLSVCSPGMIPFTRFILKRLDAGSFPSCPVVLSTGVSSPAEPVLAASVEVGGTLCDGFGDAVSVNEPCMTVAQRLRLAYNILQASGRRITRTDYVACPSCGRTLFDLQSTTERIRFKTDHLKGVKIAIMGCIVNGPGEMADADFGYVGSSPGMISLYVGRECVERNIPEADADNRLIQLIKEHNRWVEPVGAVSSTTSG